MTRASHALSKPMTGLAFPAAHVGPVSLPGTGRVAIGLRHDPSRRMAEMSQSALWIQRLMLG